jgi:hypothetical protein
VPPAGRSATARGRWRCNASKSMMLMSARRPRVIRPRSSRPTSSAGLGGVPTHRVLDRQARVALAIAGPVCENVGIDALSGGRCSLGAFAEAGVDVLNVTPIGPRPTQIVHALKAWTS